MGVAKRVESFFIWTVSDSVQLRLKLAILIIFLKLYVYESYTTRGYLSLLLKKRSMIVNVWHVILNKTNTSGKAINIKEACYEKKRQQAPVAVHDTIPS